MNAEIKALWLARLRDPTVRQCRGRRYYNGAECAIGSLYIVCRTSSEGELEATSGVLEEHRQKLVKWNDEDKLSLPQIADRIEAEF